jgi:Fumarase C C-terminus
MSAIMPRTPALSPAIGYDEAAAISCYAIDHDLTLKEAALAKGVSEELFDRVVDPVALSNWPGSSAWPGLPRLSRGDPPGAWRQAGRAAGRWPGRPR